MQGQEIDRRSDIYSFGVVAYELRSNRLPFAGTTAIELAFKTVHQEPLPLESLAGDTTKEYGDLVERCLQKKPQARYQTMTEVLSALEISN